MFYVDAVCLPEANAASLVCHQRNAISGRGAGIFVLTHFPNARRTRRIKCSAKHDGARSAKWNQFPLGEADVD